MGDEPMHGACDSTASTRVITRKPKEGELTQPRASADLTVRLHVEHRRARRTEGPAYPALLNCS